MKTILVLTDFSLRAEYVASFAINIAIRNNSNLIFCHVMELTCPDEINLKHHIPHAANEKTLNLNEIEKSFKRIVRGNPESKLYKPNINCIIELGTFADAAEKIVKDKLVDLVIIGSKKADGISRFQFGSQTYTLPDKINCPVLLIPEGLQFQGINTIVYATDLPLNNQKALRFLAELAKPFKAKIKVNHISKRSFAPKTSEKDIASSLNKQLGGDYPLVLYRTLKEDTLTAGLLKMIGSDKVNILALVHRKYQFVEGLFHASLSKLMADKSCIPLLILPNSLISNHLVILKSRSKHLSN